jgi:hypothetical protein
LELDKCTKEHYDKVYLSHTDGNVPKEILESVIAVCEDIKAGNIYDFPLDFLGDNLLIAKAMDYTDKYCFINILNEKIR